MTGTAYVVATPIGNLGDITGRAAQVLGEVEVCYAEDTRRTRKLLSRLDTTTRVRSLHQHNERSRTEEVLGLLGQGQSVAIVSDAGTPTVSDPGVRVVSSIRGAGYVVRPVPGPSAVVAAISVSGLSADRFRFLGFPPRKRGAREAWIGELRLCTETAVFFEAPGRVARLLDELSEAGLGTRHAVVCREMTKLHEEVTDGPVATLAASFASKPCRGEVTIVMAGADADNARPALGVITERARSLSCSGLSRREVAARLTAEFGVSRNEAYTMSLEAEGRSSGE